jgi:hypothetical protein
MKHSKNFIATQAYLSLGIAILFAAFLQSQVAAQKAQVSNEVRFVAAGIEDARHHLQCAHVKVERYQLIPKEALMYIYSRPNAPKISASILTKDDEQRQVAWWNLRTPDISITVEPDQTDSQQILRYERLNVNKNIARLLQAYQRLDKDKSNERGQYYYEGFIRNPSTIIKNDLWHAYEYLDPRFYAYSAVGIPLEQLFLNGATPAIFKGEEKLYNSRCMKIEVIRNPNYYEIYWIDIEHSFIVRRVENYSRVDDKSMLIGETRIPNLIGKNNQWLPGTVERKDFVSGPKIFNFQRIIFSEFNNDCQFSPETFDFSWPLGTNVTDEINIKDLVVASIETKDFVSLQRLKTEQEAKSKNEKSRVNTK